MGLPMPDSSVPQCLGIVSNPMQQGEVAKICLFGVADYSWNTKSFNTKQNWDASFPAIVGTKLSPVYKFLANYLRFQDPEELHDMIEQFKSNNDDFSRKRLTELFKSIQDSTCKMLSLKPHNNSDSLLLNDLTPWLCKLNKMAEVGASLLNINSIGDENTKWITYCDQLSILESFKYDTTYMVSALEGMGENPPSELHRVEPSHKYLMPFLEDLIEHIYPDRKSTRETNYLSVIENGVETAVMSSHNNRTIGGMYYVDSLSRKIEPGNSVVIKFPKGGVVNDAFISKEIFGKYAIGKSLYGKEYETIKNYKQLINSKLRYIKLQNKTKYVQPLELNKSNLRIGMPMTPKISSVYIPDGRIWDGHNAQKLIDGSLNTFTCLYRDQKDGDSYTIKLDKKQHIHDVTIAFGTTNLDFPKLGVVQISSDSINWKNLNVINTNTSNFRMSLPQVKKINNDVSSCTFVNDGSSAQYVRFVVKESFQERWLRLNEIEVNSLNVTSQYISVTSVNNKENVELSDGKFNTMYIPESDKDTIEYNLFGLTEPKEVVVYAIGLKKADGNNTSVVQVLNNGKYENIGILRAGINRFSLRKYNKAEKLVITILNKTFGIAEIEDK